MTIPIKLANILILDKIAKKWKIFFSSQWAKGSPKAPFW